MTPPTDFDFIIGTWQVKHRRLKARLVGCDEWAEFNGQSRTTKVLGGFGNLEDNHLELPEGPYRAAALRSFDASTFKWSIWWLDGRTPGVLDTPVVGVFESGVGVFYADDSLDGQPIKVRFTWVAAGESGPHWAQAFSADAGRSWETNWTMQFTRTD
jgi:hypothetical protein